MLRLYWLFQSVKKFYFIFLIHFSQVQFHKNHHDDLKVKISEVNRTLDNNNKLMDQMKHHHQIELRKGETARKDLIDENAILHSQVEKVLLCSFVFFSMKNLHNWTSHCVIFFNNFFFS